LDGYKHVVKEAYCPAIFSDTPTFLQETTGRQSVTKVIPRSMEAALNQDSLEEDMIQGLQQASWQKVDLSFHSASGHFLLTTQLV
jgi:hypothetical protein